MQDLNPLTHANTALPSSDLPKLPLPLAIFERIIRVVFAGLPLFLSKRFTSFEKTVTWLGFYLMLQVLALLWAFLLTCVTNLALMASHTVTKQQFPDHITAFANFFVVYATFRILVGFGKGIWNLAWESLDDFPSPRRLILDDQLRPQMHLTSSALYILALLTLLLTVTPPLCEPLITPKRILPDSHETGSIFHANSNAELQGNYSTTHCVKRLYMGVDCGFSSSYSPHCTDQCILQDIQRNSDTGIFSFLVSGSLQWTCQSTPLRFLVPPYSAPQRTLKLTIIICFIQWIQLFLFQCPSWRRILPTENNSCEPIQYCSPVDSHSASITLSKRTRKKKQARTPKKLTSLHLKNERNEKNERNRLDFRIRVCNQIKTVYRLVIQSVLSVVWWMAQKFLSRKFASFYLMLLAPVSIAWVFQWIFIHASQPTSEIMWEDDKIKSVGLWLLFAWMLWFGLILGIAGRCPNATYATQESAEVHLRRAFFVTKSTLILTVSGFFFRATLHPSMGVLFAQSEFTLVTFLLPCLYVSMFAMIKTASALSFRLFLVALPIAILVSTVVCSVSNMASDHPWAIHAASRLPEWTKTYYKQVVGMDLGEKAQNRSSGEMQWTTLFETLPSINPMIFVLVVFYILDKIVDFFGYRRDELHSAEANNQSLAKSKAGYSWIRGIIRGAISFILIFSLFLGMLGSLSVLQSKANLFPALIEYQQYDGHIKIDHMKLITLKLYQNVNITQHNMTKHSETKIIQGSRKRLRKEPFYASCPLRWHGLGLLDYALLSEAAYFDLNEEGLERLLSIFFPRGIEEWKVRFPHSSQHSYAHAAKFIEAYSKNLNLSVVAVRGTDPGRLSDYIEDVKMYAEPVAFKILSTIFPTIRMWSDSTTSSIVKWFHEMRVLLGFEHASWYYQEILNFTRSIKDRNVILTGHSLGGGLARLVGSYLRLPSITFSAPGVGQTYQRLSTSPHDSHILAGRLHHQTINVVPENDVVPLVDAQAGLLQRVQCNVSHLAIQNSCHALEGTLCELLQHCGDHQGRFQDCDHEYKISALLPYIHQWVFSFPPYVVFPTAFVLCLCVLSCLLHVPDVA